VRRAWWCSILVVAASPLAAQQAVANGDVHVRTGQSTSSRILDTLFQGDTVTLLSRTKTKGYYHIQEVGGTKGWAYARYLDTIPSATIATNPTTPATPGATAVTPSSTISASWAKTDPNHTDMTNESNPSQVCHWSGKTGSTETVVEGLKNRTDVPTEYHVVTWDAIAHLPWPRGASTHRQPDTAGHGGWTQAQLDSIAPYEREALTASGFIAKIRPQASNHEATNCDWGGELNTDWHIEFVGSFSGGHAQSETEAVVVETTPRLKRLHPKWATLTAYENPAHSTDSVRFSGWLMLDPEHKAHLGLYRQTLWEIHPITKIEVFKNGHWVDLDDLP
jgi:uncharacterized protein YraI